MIGKTLFITNYLKGVFLALLGATHFRGGEIDAYGAVFE